MTTTIKIFTRTEKVQGFTFQDGFAAVFEGDRIVAATSGWIADNGEEMLVYRPTLDGWEPEWEDEATFPFREVSGLIAAYEEEIAIKKALQYLAKPGRVPHVSTDRIYFTDKVQGDKPFTGGEYGYWTEYLPIKGLDGVYRVYTYTTCAISECGTGYEGIYALTEEDYQRLRAESDKIIQAGSLY